MVYALDCEMVGGPNNKSTLACVAIVDKNEQVVYEAFVKPDNIIIDYRFAINQTTKNKIDNGQNFQVVKNAVQNIIRNETILGHDIKFDLEALGIDHPTHLIKDTAHYRPLQFSNGQPRKLQDLALEILGRRIQEGEHSASEDAKAVMAIYKRYNF